MNSVIWLTAVACLTGIQTTPSLPPLPVNPGGIGGLFRGPNSETIIKGPDGSQITSEQIGGAVHTEAQLEPIIVPEQIGDQIAISSVSVAPIESTGSIGIQEEIPIGSPTPLILSSDSQAIRLQESTQLASPQLLSVHNTVPLATAQAVTVDVTAEEPHIIETELVDAPEIEPNQSSDLKGPSGTISVRGSSSIISGPSSTTISEPVRKLPIATIPIQPVAAQLQPLHIETVAPATVLIPPAPIVIQNNINSLQSDIGLRTDLYGSGLNAQTPLLSLTGTAGAGIADASLRTDLAPPHIQSISSTQVPLIALTPQREIYAGEDNVNGVSGTDVTAPPQIQIISSTQAPPLLSSSQNSIDLGQTLFSSTQSPISISSSGDIDVSRINLGQGSIQTVSIPNAPTNLAVSSSLTPVSGGNVIPSTSAQFSSISQSPITLQQSDVIYNSASRSSGSLPISGSNIQGISGISSQGYVSTLNTPNSPLETNIVNGRLGVQDQAILTNQLASSSPGYTAVDGRDVITPSQAPLDVGTLINTQSRPWLNVQPAPQQIISSTLLPPVDTRSRIQNLGPVASVFDTVLVQPTDPKNREVIEFGGRQLENVGNIVPVVRNPILVSGNLGAIHQIPTASVSQLSGQNDLDPNIYRRYGRKTENEK